MSVLEKKSIIASLSEITEPAPCSPGGPARTWRIPAATVHARDTQPADILTKS